MERRDDIQTPSSLAHSHLASHQFMDEEGERHQFITFTVEGQEYGIDIMAVKEIKGWSNTTILPNTPAYMRGVINLRGTVVPILDLRKRFGKGFTEATKNHVVMITTVGSRIMGILVDAVSDILMVSSEQIRSVPEVEKTKESSFLSGLVNLDNRMVVLLVLDKLFDQSIDIQDDMGFESSMKEIELSHAKDESHAQELHNGDIF